MSANDTERISDQVRAILDRVFPLPLLPIEQEKVLNKPTVEEITKAFQDLEALGQPAFDIVARRLRVGLNDPVGRLLAAVGEPAFKYIEHTLKTGNVEERCGAVSVIGAWDPTTALPKLRDILWTDADDQVRRAAAYRLLMKGEEGLSIVATALNDVNPQVRLAAVDALSSVVTAPEDRDQLDKHEPLIKLLLQLLSDPDTEVRERATRALAIIERLPMDAVDVALHDDESVGIRRMGLMALFDTGIITERAARLVTTAIEDKRREIVEHTMGLITTPKRGDVNYELLTNAIIDELVLRKSGRPDQYFNSDDIAEAIKRAIQQSPRIRGLTLQRLCDIAYEHHNSARRRSVLVANKVARDEFIAMVNERAEESPSAAQAIRQLFGIGIDASEFVQRLSVTDPGDIQGNAAIQIGLLEQYYKEALNQAKTSFWWATGAMTLGLVCLVVSLVYLLQTGVWNATAPPAVGSTLSSFIAGVQFYLYGQTRKQLSDFQRQMDRTQRFLLANSVCESLEGETKQQTRAQLVQWIATLATDAEDFGAETKS